MVLLAQLAHHLRDGIEAVYDETTPQRLPALVLAALHPDIDHRSPSLTTHLVKSACSLSARSILLIFSHASGHVAAMKTLHSGRIDSNLSKHTFEGNEMGLGPPILALYRQLKLLGTFEDIDSVVELGSQGVWCPDRRLLLGLFEAFGRPIPSRDELDVYINSSGTGLAASRHLHEKLGFKYDCVDIDGNFGSLTLDINFDAVPAQARGKYGLTTNHGTTEHVLDQRNAFKMINDFTAPGGLMLHALPFTVHLEHGFFNYQPNLFDALARYNSYQTLGTWVG